MPDYLDADIGAQALHIATHGSDLPDAERAAFVREACAGNPRLRDEVQRLIDALQPDGNDFLEHSPLRVGGLSTMLTLLEEAIAEGDSDLAKESVLSH